MPLLEEKCFVCGGDLNPRLRGRDYFMGVTKSTFNIMKCENCGIEMIIPFPSADEIKNYYPSDYYSFNIRKNRGILTKIKEFAIKCAYSGKKISLFLSKIIDHYIYFGLPMEHVENNRFLDIGCGDGEDVELMNKFGWDSYGVDIGEKEIRGNLFFDSGIEEIDFGDMKFDFIRVWHTIEHIPDPDIFLGKIKKIISNEGDIIFCFPNTKSLGAVLFGKFWFGRDIPRHLINYNLKNFKMLLGRNGFEIYKVKHCSINSLAGSLGFFASGLFGKKVDFFNNALVVALFYPLEVVLRFLRLSDVISCSAKVRL